MAQTIPGLRPVVSDLKRSPEDMHAAKAKRTTEAILRCLVAQDPQAMLRLAPRSRMKAEEIRAALSEYGRTPVMPAAPIEELIDAVEVRGSFPKCWSVDVPLWTKEEGRSDLTLQMHFTESDEEFYSVEINDLHVL